MEIEEYKRNIHKPLRQVTICFLIRDNKGDSEVLLGLKKIGFGKGKWNGAGGKREDIDKTIKDTTIRETRDEIGVEIFPSNLRRAATINFYFPEIPQEENWNQKVFVYLATKWQGNLQESEELAPLRWFPKIQIPYTQMWSADKLWLPQILAGKKIKADIMFIKNLKTGEFIPHKYHIFSLSG